MVDTWVGLGIKKLFFNGTNNHNNRQSWTLSLMRLSAKPALLLAFAVAFLSLPAFAVISYEGLLNRTIFAVVGVAGFVYVWHLIEPLGVWDTNKAISSGFLFVLWTVVFAGFGLAGVWYH